MSNLALEIIAQRIVAIEKKLPSIEKKLPFNSNKVKRLEERITKLENEVSYLKGFVYQQHGLYQEKESELKATWDESYDESASRYRKEGGE